MKQIDISMETANALAGAVEGLAAEEVFAALNEELEEPVNLAELASVLYDEDGLDLDAEDVAKAMKAIPSIDNADIADALYSSKGADLDGSTVAGALKDGCGLGAVEVANALYSEKGCDLDGIEIATVMDGTFDHAEIAAALYSEDGLDLDTRKVAEILHDSDDYNPHLDGLGLDFNQTAQVMAEAVIDVKEAARALYGLDPRGGELGHGGSTGLTDVVWAITAHYDLDLNEAAEVLYSKDGLDRDASEVAGALYNYDTSFTPDAAEVARALKDGCDLDAVEVAKALKDGCDLDAVEVADALYSSTYDEKKINGAGQHHQAVSDTLYALCSGDGLGMDIEDAVKALHGAGVAKADIRDAMTAEVEGGMEYSAAEVKKIMGAAFPGPRAPRPRDNGLEL